MATQEEQIERVVARHLAFEIGSERELLIGWRKTDDELLTVARIIRGSRTLQERLTVGWESGAAAVTAAIAETSGAADDDLVPGIVARTLWWTHRSIFFAALYGLLAEEDREQLVVRLRVAADRAYDQLAGGLGEYGKGG